MVKKPLGPPKGAGAAANAVAAATESEDARIDRLSSRYQQEQAGQARPTLNWSPTASRSVEPTPAPAPAIPPPAAPTRRGQARRAEPDGMTRRTYYLADDAAAALDDAVARIRRATGGSVSKHAALGALIAAGVAQTEAVTQSLREEVLRSLTAGQ